LSCLLQIFADHLRQEKDEERGKTNQQRSMQEYVPQEIGRQISKFLLHQRPKIQNMKKRILMKYGGHHYLLVIHNLVIR
jgi:hypothetical protein